MSRISTGGHRVAVAFTMNIYRGLWLGWRLVRSIVIGLFALGLSVGAVIGIATWQRSLDLPGDYRELLDAREKGSASFYALDGSFLGIRGQKHERASYSKVSPVVIDAILATEDLRFFWHTGVDPLGIARALWVNWRAGRTAQGGSSLTQQVAKSFVGSERALGRKLRELAFAFALEYKYTKPEILEIYMNRVYLGAGAYGFRAAAKTYFKVDVEKISPAQAALLAGLLRAPSKWSPTNDFTKAQGRARVILGAMFRSGKLDYDQYLTARVEIDQMKPPVITERSSYFVDWALDEIPAEVWKKADDVIVRTTLDPRAQKVSEESVEKIFAEHAKRDKAAQAALVILSKDGAVRAMVGGRDYARSEFNRAAKARRQLGSAFKPFVFAAAFEAGVSPGSKVLDGPVTIRTASGAWSPRNYSRRYLGWIPLSVALARSSNVAAVRLFQAASMKRVIALARRAGFKDHIPPFPSLALGVIETNPLEVAGAYASFNRGGLSTPGYGIVEITDRRGNVLWRHKANTTERVMPKKHAEWMVSLLRSVVDGGTGRRARLGERPAAGKTGTTQNYSDAWFAGFTGDFIGVVWMGNDIQEKTLHRVTGGSIPAMIWQSIMEPIHEGMPIAALAESTIPSSYAYVGTSAEPVSRSRATPRRRVRRTRSNAQPVRPTYTRREPVRERIRERRRRRRELWGD
ncbi:MAG: PBP1A family penicillin-binding protein [Neomegalonema sp.]|nr:PBP1A family penicillin-binding protein [Neomegalonema sp.]